MSDPKILTLGAGFAGYGASHHLHQAGVSSTVLEKQSQVGGHATSHVLDGRYIFDDGPHISFTRDKRIQDILANAVDGEYETVSAAANNYWNGYWFKHPVQCNLSGLPTELVVSCIEDFVAAQASGDESPPNYELWLRQSYGDTLAETFPMRYAEKYHTVQARQMSTVWLGPRLYRPELNEVLHGALTQDTKDVHYVDHFRYPKYGGFKSYFNKFHEWANLQMGSAVTGIDTENHQVTLRSGQTHSYEGLISSLPLPELIPMISDVPDQVVKATEKLAATSAVLVNVVINRRNISDHTWTYFYDDDILFTRLSYPHMLSPHTMPDGMGAIQAEIYFSDKYKPLDTTPESLVSRVISDLKRVGLIKPDDSIAFSNSMYCRYANVIFDLDREECLPVVHQYLDEQSIAYCGRFGEWGYHWTDESFKSGEAAAGKILNQL